MFQFICIDVCTCIIYIYIYVCVCVSMHIVCFSYIVTTLGRAILGLLNKCKEMPVYVLVYAVLLSFNFDEEIGLVTVGEVKTPGHQTYPGPPWIAKVVSNPPVNSIVVRTIFNPVDLLCKSTYLILPY